MLVSFKTIIFVFTAGLFAVNLFYYCRKRDVPVLLTVLTLYWVVAMIFFRKALVNDFCLVPGDLLCWKYPWKAVLPPDIPPHNPLLFDSIANYYPWMNTIKSAMARLFFPFWNFHAYSGSPFIANFASAVFYPLNIFLFFMTVADFSTFMPFLRIIIAGSGTFLFLRTLKFSPVPSLMGGFLFSYCGVNVVWLSNCPNISVIICMPWLMTCMDRIAAGKSIRWFFLLIFWSVFQFLGGHPESSFHVYLIVVPWFFYRLYERWRYGDGNVEILKRFLMVAIAGSLSLGAVSFQLLPFLEYLPHTSRYFEMVEKGTGIVGDFKFQALLKLVTGTMINPDFFGNPVDYNYWTFANYNEQNTYFSVAGLFLSVLGIFKKNTRNFGKYFFAAAAVFSFSMIVRVPFFYGLVKQLPGFDIATNYRLIFAFVFCMTIFAVSGLETLCSSRSVTMHQIWLVCSVLLFTGICVHYFTSCDIPPVSKSYRLNKLIFFFMMLGIVAILSASIVKFPQASFMFSVLFVFVILIDCLYHGINYNTFMDKKNVYPETPLMRFIDSLPGKFRVVGWDGSLMAGAEQVHGYDSITGYDPMKVYSYERILTLINGSYNPVGTCEIQSLDSKWLNFLNVRYVVTPPDYRDAVLNSHRFDLVYKGQDGCVYENRDAFHRISWAVHIIDAESRKKAFQIIEKNEFSPDEMTVVEKRPELPGEFNRKLSGQGRVAQNPEDGDTDYKDFSIGCEAPLPEILRYDANRIVLELPASGMPADTTGSVLVLSEVWFPGWNVFVDGRKRQMLRINSSFMGAQVNPGEKKVSFVFEPDSFKRGMGISMLSFFIIFLSGVFSTIYRRQKIKNISL